MKVVLRVGHVYKFSAQHQSFASIHLYSTFKHPNPRMRGRVEYRSLGQSLTSGETFVVLDVTPHGDFLIFTSKKKAGLIYSSHVNFPQTSWNEVHVPNDADEEKK